MEVTDQSLGALRDLLANILSSDNALRKQSEAYLKSNEVQPGFPLLILTLINKLVGSNTPQDVAIRQSASVLFKNMVKNKWVSEDEPADCISQTDKDLIKTHVVELMCVAPQDVQSQLAEAVTLISKHDFPARWAGLLPQLVAKLGTQELGVSKGVMLTANSIMKRFRYVFKSDELYTEILFCMEGFNVPLLQQFQAYGGLVGTYAQNKAELGTVFETLRLMGRIYFSLNWQDIPEFFEDNIAAWMEEFAKYLSYSNPLLVDADEASEPGPVECLQAAVLENLNLYATKYEDIFEPFLPQFTQLVWKLLMEVSAQPKYDILATSAIKFLTSVSGKQMNTALFTAPVLKDIVEHIVVKNLTATETDEELFEDNPTDYIRKDMEGSDQDTRRRSASELVRSLLKFFSVQVSELCVTYISAMLSHYSVSKDWRAKDAALHLVLAVAVRSANSASGAGELNPNIDIMSIFNSHVLPEVHDPDVNCRPIVKADAIKLICVFRTHLQAPYLLAILPHIIRHLHSEHVVISTYAAVCVERFLTVKDRGAGTAYTYV
ncbi:CSE1 chromosome segregation 1-like protein isoform a [Ochromonadaceae sp. CCMP2298]|nr:CSE1 chromosome segregation 1-like protein isoform a [Ochromonadaceae sp. CCMP2298]